MIEFDWHIAIFNEVFINNVEHLEKRHILADPISRVGFEVAFLVGSVLSPNFELEVKFSGHL